MMKQPTLGVRILTITDNGSGDARVTCAGRHLLNGEAIMVLDASIAAYNAIREGDYSIVSPTVIDLASIGFTSNATGGRLVRA